MKWPFTRIKYSIPTPDECEGVAKRIRATPKEEWDRRIRETIDGVDRTIAHRMNVSPEVQEKSEKAGQPTEQPAP